ncbi:MAG: hypothetical protein R3C59_03080 [Planctomycetaceae bacterium]
MDHIVPPSLMFDYQLPIPRCELPATRKTGRLLSLPAGADLFLPASMNEGTGFASIGVGWNPDGLAFSFHIDGKPGPPTGRAGDLKTSDSILLWIDTRPSGNVHRATEYCHHFAALPRDEDHDNQPHVLVLPIAQQRDRKIESDPRRMLTRTHVTAAGYDFELWIPGTQLFGFRETSEIGRIGFYAVVQDSHLGDQPLSVDDRFPCSYDPSLWLPLELKS